MDMNPRVRNVLRIGFYISIALSAFLCVFYSYALATYCGAAATGQTGAVDARTIGLAIAFLITLAVSTVADILLLYHARKDELRSSRLAARVAVIALVLNMLLAITLSGISWEIFLYLFQFIVLVVYQLQTDRFLSHPEHFHNPFAEDRAKAAAERAEREQLREQRKETRRKERREKRFRRRLRREHEIVRQARKAAAEREETEAEYYQQTGKTLKGYIPLNFFNLFWIFFVASVLGLVIEVIWHAVVFGGYQDRAGLLWGPFSPIYGFGAVLMTIALNRFWDRSKLMIFVVAGAIGAAFEFCVSFFMEYSFGIVAWDYSGTFLNIGGRTNFAFFCAWGFLGLVWIRLILPDVLRIIDVMPLKWRSSLTAVAAAFLIFDGAMTLVTLDCWYQREAGLPVETSIQQLCAEQFDNDFMANRFQSMSIDPNNATRIG